VQNANRRFVHYCDASSAIVILTDREIWMRNVACMNDYSEVEHGWKCLAEAYRGAAGQTLQNALNATHAGVCDEVAAWFDRGGRQNLLEDTYVTCVSEHGFTDNEDSYGRLAMWRAYGRGAGVALVLNNGPFFSRSNVLKVVASPVAYLDSVSFSAQFARLAQNVESNLEFVHRLSRQQVHDWLLHTFRFAAICTKHPGFEEEREWRVVHNPGLIPSPELPKLGKVIGSIPQQIYKIPLRNQADLTGLDIAQFINRIIIGPLNNPRAAKAAKDAFVHLLEQNGVREAYEKVIVSDIPLR
jgi:hypothetical protein